MQVFLASIPMEGRAVLVVGGGEMATAKARLLSKTPAQLRWFVPQGLESPAPGLPVPLPRWPQADDLAQVALVFIGVAAEHDAQVDDLARRARAGGALVNVIDRPARSDFQTPALVDRGDVVVAIATGGVAPIMARDLRARIEAAIPQNTRTLAKVARAMRPQVVASSLDGLQRRRFWEAALRGEAAQLALEGREEEAHAAMRRLLEGEAPPRRGVVHIVGAGPGDPELLTLQALRLLQDADLVVHGSDVAPAIADYARRDARRAAPGPDLATQLLPEAASGHRIVRLVAGDPGVAAQGEAQALRAAGLDVHLVPGVSATSRPA